MQKLKLEKKIQKKLVKAIHYNPKGGIFLKLHFDEDWVDLC